MTSDGVRVVAVRPDEWPRYRELRLEALRTDPLAFGSTLERELAFPEALWRERLSNPHSHNLVALVGPEDEWCGMASAALFDGQYHLFAMWVRSDARRRGVGGNLLDAAIAWVHRVEPRAPLLLDVNPRQESAVRLYRSRGFELTGTTAPLGHTPGETISRMVLRA
jgi:ribosomal protein S18 acetylase RimI-like enzyme